MNMCRCDRTAGCELALAASLYTQAFRGTKQRLLNYIDGYLYCEYGQFTEVDELLDEFRKRVEELNE